MVHSLRIADLSAPGDQTVVQGSPAEEKFSVFCFRNGVLAAVESVDQPADHLAARRTRPNAIIEVVALDRMIDYGRPEILGLYVGLEHARPRRRTSGRTLNTPLAPPTT